MSELPEIGATVHATVPDTECLPLFVHAHMTPTHLALADVPPAIGPADLDPRPGRTVFAVISDVREPGTWHPVHD